jgi:hypothetical protein
MGCNITKALNESCFTANFMELGYWPLRLKLRMLLGIKVFETNISLVVC